MDSGSVPCWQRCDPAVSKGVQGSVNASNEQSCSTPAHATMLDRYQSCCCHTPIHTCVVTSARLMLPGGQPARAEQLFDRLCSVCKPDASTFNCLVCVYCRLGKVREAANMLEIMLRSGQHVDPPTFDAVIDACWSTGVVPQQQYAQQLHERARQQGLYQTLTVKQVRQGLSVASISSCAAGGIVCLHGPVSRKRRCAWHGFAQTKGVGLCMVHALPVAQWVCLLPAKQRSCMLTQACIYAKHSWGVAGVTKT